MLAKVITSKQHPIVKEVVSLRKEAKERRNKKKVLLFGEKMIREYQKEVLILITEKNSSFVSPSKTHIKTSEEILKKMAGYEEKALAIVPYPESSDLSDASFVVALDKVQDPVNIGSLFRTSLGLFVEGVIILEGSSDLFHEKSIRASKGAVFSLPFQRLSHEAFLFWIKTTKRELLIADTEGISIKGLSLQGPSILLMSNEGQGPSSCFKKVGKKITIPMRKNLESYNVAIAAAIILYQLRTL